MQKVIGLVDCDSHNFPNLCLMKLSTYHKARGDYVEWYSAKHRYDIVYVSKVFTESHDFAADVECVGNATKVLRGGSGYDLTNKLPYDVEHATPDYSIYPEFDFALGFLTRGCPRKNHAQSCGGFCITPDKDGCKPRKTADLSEFWIGQKKIYLLDQNLLACRDKFDLLKQLADSKAEIYFDGGLDIRYMTNDVIEAFRPVNVKEWHFAWDDPKEDLRGDFKRVADSGLCRMHGEPHNPVVYVLTNFWSTHDEDLFRVNELRKLGFDPYVMIYDKQKFVDKRGRLLSDVFDRYTEEQVYNFRLCQLMQRWTANRKIWKTTPNFSDYENYKNFAEYGWKRERERLKKANPVCGQIDMFEGGAG